MKTTVKLASGLGALAAVASVASGAHAQDGASATATGSGTATVVDPFSVNKTADLTFGRIVKPSTGTATVSVDASGGRTVTGTAAVGGGAGAAQFDLLGPGGTAYSITVPSSFNIQSGASTLAVATVNNATAGTLSGSAGTYTTVTFGVGGQINLTTATPSGAYTGNFVVTASYN